MLCFVLIMLGRVVNLGVPLVFKRVVDTLSAVTAHVSKEGAASTLRALCGLGGDPPSFTFWDVFLPWVAAYLALYFLQGKPPALHCWCCCEARVQRGPPSARHATVPHAHHARCMLF